MNQSAGRTSWIIAAPESAVPPAVYALDCEAFTKGGALAGPEPLSGARRAKRNGKGSRGPGLANSGEAALGMRGVLHGLNALLDRLKSGREHGCGQLGYALAIAHSGFDSFLDQPLLQLDELCRAFHCS